jgi:adenosylcobinamide hydrolase
MTSGGTPTCETAVRDGVLQVCHPGTRWLASGWDGGVRQSAAAYNVSVPDGWDRTDLDAYVQTRRDRAGFSTAGPALLTGVDMRHARGARLGPVAAYATVGLSNPAALPVDPTGRAKAPPRPETDDGHVGTVNLLVHTRRALSNGALTTLLSVAVEAKTATLLSLAGFPGTTSDAVVVGTDEDGESATFAGSATEVGAAARACVRDAVRASFRSRYADEPVAASVADAAHGVVTDRSAAVFEP